MGGRTDCGVAGRGWRRKLEKKCEMVRVSVRVVTKRKARDCTRQGRFEGQETS